MNAEALVPLRLSLAIAGLATVLILPPGILLGRLLARRRFPGKSVVETFLYLPLVLPPTAVGYVLLTLLSRDGPLGARTLGFDLDVLFTWRGATLAAAVMALPLVVRAARSAFEEVDPRLEGMARTLGLGPVGAFFAVSLPLARRGLAAAALLGFARSLGEFGATVIVAGSIPGRTRTLALAIFADIQSGSEREALGLVAITVALAFAALWSVERLARGRGRAR